MHGRDKKVTSDNKQNKITTTNATMTQPRPFMTSFLSFFILPD